MFRKILIILLLLSCHAWSQNIKSSCTVNNFCAPGGTCTGFTPQTGNVCTALNNIGIMSACTEAQPALSLLPGTYANGKMCTYTLSGTLLNCNTNIPTECSLSSCDLSASTTLGGNPICVNSGSGCGGGGGGAVSSVSASDASAIVTPTTGAVGVAVNWQDLYIFAHSGVNWANIDTLNGTQPITGTKTFNATITGSISGNAGTATSATSATSATNATNSAITDDTTTNATMYPVWVTANTGNLPLKVSSTKVSFNPSSGILSDVGENISGLTASQIVGTDGSKNLVSLAVATYPSLTELSYIKGLTSAIQTQLNLLAPLISPSFTTPALGTPASGVMTNVTGLPSSAILTKVSTVTAGATPTIVAVDGTDFEITGLSTAITSMTTNLSGTTTNGAQMEIDITDDGTARALTFGTSFASTTVSLPTTTVISTRLRMWFQYNSTTSKWEIVGRA